MSSSTEKQTQATFHAKTRDGSDGWASPGARRQVQLYGFRFGIVLGIVSSSECNAGTKNKFRTANFVFRAFLQTLPRESEGPQNMMPDSVAQLAPGTPRHRFGIWQVSPGVSFSSQYKPTHEAHFDFDSPAETSQLLSTSRARAVPAQAAQLFSTRVVQEQSFIP